MENATTPRGVQINLGISLRNNQQRKKKDVLLEEYQSMTSSI